MTSTASRMIGEVLAPGDRATLVAVCPPYRKSLPLGPVADALRRTAGAPGVRGPAGLGLSPLAGALRPLLPEWEADLPAAREPMGDPRAARHRQLRALAELLDRLGVRLLVVEDAHWADEGTLELVLFLASQPGRCGVLVSYRPEDLPDGSLVRRLSAPASAGAAYLRLSLPPLDRRGTSALMSALLDGEPVSEGFSAFLYAHTGGLPLAVEESVRLLQDRADLVRTAGHWVGRGVDRLHSQHQRRAGVRLPADQSDRSTGSGRGNEVERLHDRCGKAWFATGRQHADLAYQSRLRDSPDVVGADG